MTHSPHPLEWPVGYKRTTYRKHSRFKALSFTSARDGIIKELKNMKARDIVLSSDVPVRGDGLPYAGYRQPKDPGVAVYFSIHKYHNGERQTKYFAIACDAYYKIEENMRALVHTLDAMRTIQRHGSQELLEQAMSGFAALPAPGDEKPWWQVLGLLKLPTVWSVVELRYRDLVKLHHPDRGGSTERMQEINVAYEQGQTWATRQKGWTI